MNERVGCDQHKTSGCDEPLEVSDLVASGDDALMQQALSQAILITKKRALFKNFLHLHFWRRT